MPDYVDAMAYAGETPWHGLGTRLPEDAGSEEMRKAAGLDWQALKRPALAQDPDGPVEIPGAYFLIRSDTRGPLSKRAVSGQYEPIQPKEVFDFGDALAKTGAARWHTAGALHGGRRIWALAQCAGQFEPRALRDGTKDVLAPFLLLYNTFDGSSTFRVRFTTVRVVCANTAAMALGEEGQAEASIRHSGDVKAKLEQAREVLGMAERSFHEQVEVYRRLAETPMSGEDFDVFAARLLTDLDDVEKAMKRIADSEGRSRTIFECKGSELRRLFESGRGNAGETAVDAFNAVTEFVDHQRARMGNYKRLRSRLTEGGLDSAWFGRGEATKQRALRLLTR